MDLVFLPHPIEVLRVAQDAAAPVLQGETVQLGVSLDELFRAVFAVGPLDCDGCDGLLQRVVAFDVDFQPLAWQGCRPQQLHLVEIYLVGVIRRRGWSVLDGPI